MNEQELRVRLDALFAEYGGPIRPFMEAVVTWGRRSDLTDSLSWLDEVEWDGGDPVCEKCGDALCCEQCENLINEDDCNCDECEVCGDDKVCLGCLGYAKKQETKA